jgi:hypothetical protein
MRLSSVLLPRPRMIRRPRFRRPTGAAQGPVVARPLPAPITGRRRVGLAEHGSEHQARYPPGVSAHDVQQLDGPGALISHCFSIVDGIASARRESPATGASPRLLVH